MVPSRASARRSVAFTVPLPSAVLMAAPSACETISVGMVIAPVPVMVTVPEVVLATITPTAPAVWALRTWAVKAQLERSTRAILPATELTMASQPSLGVPTPSLTTTTSAVTRNDCGPKVAVPADLSPAMPAGLLTRTRVSGLNTYICMRGRPPSAGVDMLALLVPL